MLSSIVTLLQHPIIPIFLLANLAIGLWAHMKSKAGSFEDYALASRNLPLGVMILTLLGTRLGIGDLDEPDQAFNYGLIQSLISVAFVLSFFMAGTFVAPPLIYFTDCMTIGDLMGKFYGRTAQILTGIFSSLFSMLIISAQIEAIGNISHYFFQVPSEHAIMFFGIVVVLYSTWGGMRSVSYTDILQTIMALIVLGYVAQGIIRVLGWSSFQQLPSDKLALFNHPEFSHKIKAAIVWGLFPTFILTPPIVQRMLMTQDKRKVRRMWYTTALLYALILFLLDLIGLAAISGGNSLRLNTSSQGIILDYILFFLSDNKLLLDVAFIGLISVLLSTVDSYLHAIGVSCVQDIIMPCKNIFAKRNIKSSSQLNYARIGIILTGIVAILMGASGNNSFSNEKTHKIALIVITIILIPLIVGILGIKTERISFFSFVTSYLVTIGVLLLRGWYLGEKFYDCLLLGVGAGVMGYFLTHFYLNGGIVTLKRSQQTVAEQLWIPSPSNVGKAISGWFRATFNLSQLARIEVYKNRPSQSVGFSMLIFFLYTISSILGGSHGGEGFPEFMAAIHFVGIALCCGLMLEGIWPSPLRPYFPLYWLLTLFYCLPLGGTITFLRMHEGLASAFFFVGSFGLLALLVSSRAFFWMSVWGFSLAHLGWYVVHGSLLVDLWEGTYLGSCLVLGLWIVCVSFFGHQVEQHVENRLYINRALSESVAHEATHHLSPMRGVSFFANAVDHSLEPTTNAAGEKGFFLPEAMRMHVEGTSDKIDGVLDSVIEEFTNFKDIIHSDLYNEMQERVGMVELVKGVLPPILKRYEDILTIKVVSKQDFKADVIRPFFSNVLGNIARNAHLHGSAKNLSITIDGKERRIYVRDDGNGIPPEVLPRIFDLRFTTVKEKGSGVGLAFVKLILAFSGITINCHSRYGDGDSFTEFVLAFPDV